jgi:WD40 repeat protein
MLASAGGDGSVRLWDFDSDESVGKLLDGHSDVVRSVAFSPDSRLLVTAGEDGFVRVWDAPWEAKQACSLAQPYVVNSQLEPYLPTGWTRRGCRLPD